MSESESLEDVNPLVSAALAGNRLSLARILTIVENQTPQAENLLNLLFPMSGKAHRVGITGAPGTGKSSLTNKLTQQLRAQQKTIAILAVDPSSPFSGGAILGDRIRMRECAGDPGVFIRSMASRGALGGLSLRTGAAAQVLDAVGYDMILIETVGAGQAEVEIASLAHSVVVVEAPGLGDEIQAIKAGILEIADIIVVNKADQPGALRTENALMAAFHASERPAYRHHSDIEQSGVLPETAKNGWPIPILRTNALDGEGVASLCEKILLHREYLHNSGQWFEREKLRLHHEFENNLRETLYQNWRDLITDEQYQEWVDQLIQRITSPQALTAKAIMQAKRQCQEDSD